MNRIRIYWVTLSAICTLTACAEAEKEETEFFETLSLQAWIRQHRPHLQNNFQPVGNSGYYVEILDEGNPNEPHIEDNAWVRYDLSVRDLHGNIVLTRRAAEARQLGTFSRYTHYVPCLHRCGERSGAMLEGIRLALRTPLVSNGGNRRIQLKKGAQVRLFLPSQLIGQLDGQSANGYEGQTALEKGRPVMATIGIVDVMKEPHKAEERELDAFCRRNGSLEIFDRKSNPFPTSATDERHPYHPASARWTSACDSVAHIYVNHRYDPTRYGQPDTPELFDWTAPYNVGFAPYNDPLLERKIAEALTRRFHTEKHYTQVADSDVDSVKMDGTAKIWYVGRFLDGFVFDTNIDEVKDLLYERGYAQGKAFSYTPHSVESAIKAFHYVVPHMKYGQWATVATVSAHAYGMEGKTPQSRPAASDIANIMSARNPGDQSDKPDKPDRPEKRPSRATETVIPPYATLIFHLYVEPKR